MEIGKKQPGNPGLLLNLRAAISGVAVAPPQVQVDSIRTLATLDDTTIAKLLPIADRDVDYSGARSPRSRRRSGGGPAGGFAALIQVQRGAGPAAAQRSALCGGGGRRGWGARGGPAN